MAYSQNLTDSARRHLGAAILLHEDLQPGSRRRNRAVAGYLFGLAGELALKRMMLDSGMRRLENGARRDDPFFVHFPLLKTLLLNAAQGRRQGELLRHASNNRLFREWDTAMRYAGTQDIKDSLTDEWRKQAEMLVETMDL